MVMNGWHDKRWLEEFLVCEKEFSEIYGNRSGISEANEFNLNKYWKLHRTLFELQIGGNSIWVSLIKGLVFIVLHQTPVSNRRFNSPDWRFNLKTINIDICLMTRPPEMVKLIMLKKIHCRKPLHQRWIWALESRIATPNLLVFITH